MSAVPLPEITSFPRVLGRQHPRIWVECTHDVGNGTVLAVRYMRVYVAVYGGLRAGPLQGEGLQIEEVEFGREEE